MAQSLFICIIRDMILGFHLISITSEHISIILKNVALACFINFIFLLYFMKMSYISKKFHF